VLLAAQATRLHTGIPPGDWLPSRIESAKGLEQLEDMGRGGLVQLVRVVIELPPTASVLTSQGQAALVDATRAAARAPGASSVRSLATTVPRDVPLDAALAGLPETVRASLVSADARFVQLEVLPEEGASPEALTALVESLRASEAEGLTGLRDARMWVGGLPAFNADFEAAVAGRFGSVAGLVVGATLLTLIVGFRSVLIPVKAVALNLLSVAGAFGALVLVFQDGHGAGLLGLASVPGSVFPMIPVLVFCVVFGLSMDYEVFLVSRIAEARATLDEREAVAEGLARTGHVITSAAAIMIAVFGGFTLGDFVLVKMLGFTVAVAVRLDAAVVRVAIGPALIVLLGRWNWWPGDSVRQTDAGHQLLEAPLASERVVDGSHAEPGEVRRADRGRLLEQVHR
jgi:RND superfamily putative drug exporter